MRLIRWVILALSPWVPSCVPAWADSPRGWAVLSDGSRVDLGACRRRSAGEYVFSRPCPSREEALPVAHDGIGPAPAEPLTVVALEVQDGPRHYRVDARDFRVTGTSYYRGLPVRLHDEVVFGGTLIPAAYAEGTIRAHVQTGGAW